LPRLWLANSLAIQDWLAEVMANQESSYPRLASLGYGYVRVYLAKTG